MTRYSHKLKLFGLWTRQEKHELHISCTQVGKLLTSLKFANRNAHRQTKNNVSDHLIWEHKNNIKYYLFAVNVPLKVCKNTIKQRQQWINNQNHGHV